MTENPTFKKLIAFGAAAGALTSIATLVFLFFPRFRPAVIPKQAVEIKDIKVSELTRAPGRDNCHSVVQVGFKVHVEGYQNQPLRLYERLDDSEATSMVPNGLPCQLPLGGWDGWQRAKDITASVQDQTFPVQIEVAIPVKKDNWKIQLKVTDAKDLEVEMKTTETFNTR